MLNKVTNRLKGVELNNHSLALLIVILVLAFLWWVFINIKNDCSLRPTELGVSVCVKEKRKKTSAQEVGAPLPPLEENKFEQYTP